MSYLSPWKLKQNVPGWGEDSELAVCLPCVCTCATGRWGKERQGKRLRLTGESFWMRSWATCTKFLSSCMCFWKRRLSSSSSRSKSLAASSKAWMRPFQERSAGTCGATAELTPVPITSTSSGARLVFRLGSSFLWGRQKLSDDASQILSNSMKVKQATYKHTNTQCVAKTYLLFGSGRN